MLPPNINSAQNEEMNMDISYFTKTTKRNAENEM